MLTDNIVQANASTGVGFDINQYQFIGSKVLLWQQQQD